MNNNIKFTCTEAVNFRLNTEMIANLKRLARHVSYHLNDDYTYIDIIRCLLAEHLPIPEDSNTSEAQLKIVQDVCSRITKQSALAGVAKIPTTFTTSTTFGCTTTTTVHDLNMQSRPDSKIKTDEDEDAKNEE